MFPVEAFHLGLFVAIAIGCFAVWNQIFVSLAARRELVPYVPRRPVPWSGRDVALIGLLLFVAQVLAATAYYGISELMNPPATIADADASSESSSHGSRATNNDANANPTAEVAKDEQPAVAEAAPAAADDSESAEEEPVDVAQTFGVVLAASTAMLLACLAAFYYLRGRGADGGDLGLDLRVFGRDFKIGVAGFLMASIPVLLIQLILSLLVKPSHAVSDVLQGEPSRVMIAGIALVAIVIAPLTEEFFFRVILQGWLETFFARRGLRRAPRPGFTPAHSQSSRDMSLDDSAGPQPWSAEEFDDATSAPSEAAFPTIDILTPEVVRAGEEPALATLDMRPERLSIYLSSFVFAAVHLGNGPSPVPLFFYALMLGYLYRQTHRLWPSVVAHACLNALSTIVLATGGGQ